MMSPLHLTSFDDAFLVPFIYRHCGRVCNDIVLEIFHERSFSGKPKSKTDVLRDRKTGSSRWVHETMKTRSFARQEGYAPVTARPSIVLGVHVHCPPRCAADSPGIMH